MHLDFVVYNSSFGGEFATAHVAFKEGHGGGLFPALDHSAAVASGLWIATARGSFNRTKKKTTTKKIFFFFYFFVVVLGEVDG